MKKLFYILVSISVIGLMFIAFTSKEKVIKNTHTHTVKVDTLKKNDATKEVTIPSKIPKFKPQKIKKSALLDNFDNNKTVHSLHADKPELNVYKSIHPKMIEAINKIPYCLENAMNKEEAFACSKELRKLSQKLAIAMGDSENIDIKGYDSNFVWNEKTKTNMIKELERSQNIMVETQDCIDSASSSNELESCLK